MSLTKVSYSMINGDVVNVLDYGAVGDGVSNDTAAITAALATGKSVFFPKGTYLSGAQTITTQGQTLFGEGAGSIIQANSASINLFTVQADYVTFTDLRMNGIATSDSTTSFAIFTAVANPASFLTANRLLITGASSGYGFNNGIKLDENCNYPTVINCHFDRLWGQISGTGYGVLSQGNGSRIAFNNFQGSSGRGRHAVYIVSGASNCVVEANYVNAFNMEGISTNSIGAQAACNRNIYANNTVINCCASGNATSGAIGLYGHQQNNLVIGNTITGSNAKGIVVDGTGFVDCLNNVVSNNIVNYSYTYGIDYIAVVGGAITNNKIYESSNTNVGTYPNIRLISDGTTATSDILVEGNHSAGPNSARCAFQLNSTAPAPNNLTVVANKFDACQSGNSVELNGVTCAIDGRIMFRQNSVSYGPITSGSYVSASYTVSGVNTGDVCTVSHTTIPVGCVMYASASATDTVSVTVANFTGSPVTISSGALRIDAWQRPPNYL